MEEGKRDNAKSRFAQCVMQRVMETLVGFADDLVIVGDPMTPYQSKGWNFEKANASKGPDAECIRHCLPDPITREYAHPAE